MARKIAVAVSGGVDSLVTAHTLQQKGHRVIGIHFIHGYEKSSPDDITGIGRQLDIPIEIVDCIAPFKDKVVDYFVETYSKGLTPNPCMVCNPRIKFGILLEAAGNLGATRLATGHYARISRGRTGRLHLHKGIDTKKDQSYFLAFLKQNQLAAACFPLGEKTKADVIRYANHNRLRPANPVESQDVCFIQGNTYGEFLAGQKGFKRTPGPIENLSGQVIGEHGGLHLFTVGQRRGINCPAAEPYYVIRLDVARNRLVVGFKKELPVNTFTVSGTNWIGSPPTQTIQASVRVRYRGPAVPAHVTPTEPGAATVHLRSAQSGITPGQAAVFYRGSEVLGGGWIEPPAGAP